MADVLAKSGLFPCPGGSFDFDSGVSAYYHDSAAALLIDGELKAAVQEERFTRKKYDARFPSASIAYCLARAGLKLEDVDYVAFYEKPLRSSNVCWKPVLRVRATGIPKLFDGAAALDKGKAVLGAAPSGTP